MHKLPLFLRSANGKIFCCPFNVFVHPPERKKRLNRLNAFRELSFAELLTGGFLCVRERDADCEKGGQKKSNYLFHSKLSRVVSTKLKQTQFTILVNDSQWFNSLEPLTFGRAGLHWEDVVKMSKSST